MPNLFGLSDEAQMGLLTAALAAMSSSGVKPGTALARGGLLGVGAYNQGKRDREDSARAQREEEFRQMQMEEYRRKIEEGNRVKQGYANALREGLVPGQEPVEFGGGEGTRPGTPASFDPQRYAMALRDVDPGEAAKLLMPKAQDSSIWGKVDPLKVTPESRRAKRVEDIVPLPDAPGEQWEDIGERNGQMWQRNKVTNQVRAAGSVAPRISNTTIVAPGQTEFDKTMGKGRAESYLDLQKAGNAARAKVGRLDAIGALLDGIDTGGLTPTGVAVANYAKSLGITLDPNLGAKQAADALSKEMALQMRNPSGGAGMPGALSDQDRNYLTAMQPGIEKSPEGRKQIIFVQKAIAKRDIDVARMAQQYVAKHKQLDEGFYTELAQFADANPLFPTAQRPTSGGALSPTEQAELDQLRKRFGRR